MSKDSKVDLTPEAILDRKLQGDKWMQYYEEFSKISGVVSLGFLSFKVFKERLDNHLAGGL